MAVEVVAAGSVAIDRHAWPQSSGPPARNDSVSAFIPKALDISGGGTWREGGMRETPYLAGLSVSAIPRQQFDS